MSGSESDSGGQEWEIVAHGDQLEQENSDSSLEIVQLDEDGAHFTCKTRVTRENSMEDLPNDDGKPEQEVQAESGDNVVTQPPDVSNVTGPPSLSGSEPEVLSMEAEMEETPASNDDGDPTRPDPEETADLSAIGHTDLRMSDAPDDGACLADNEDSASSKGGEEGEQLVTASAASPSASLPKAENSDSDSDFVRLDGDEPRLPNSMQSSSHSSASIGSDFHFLAQYPRRQPNYDDDEDSLPGDVDDRVECDIIGIAPNPDEDDLDLSALTNGDDEISLEPGSVRSYCHSPNPNLNQALSVFAILALCFAVGIGIGHYLGSVSNAALRKEQVQRMKMAQDEYLMCLGQLETLKRDINRNVTHKPSDVQGRGTSEMIELRAMEIEIIQLKGLLLHNKEQEEQTKGKMNVLQIENQDLKTEVARLRYSAHPSELQEMADESNLQLKGKLNELAHENTDLKSAVGRLRYTTAVTLKDEETDMTTFQAPEPAPCPVHVIHRESQSDQQVTELTTAVTKLTEELEMERSRLSSCQATLEDERLMQRNMTSACKPCMTACIKSANLSHAAISESFNKLLQTVAVNMSLADSLQHYWNSSGIQNHTLALYSAVEKVINEQIYGQQTAHDTPVNSSSYNHSQPHQHGSSNHTHLNQSGKFQDYINKTKQAVNKLGKKVQRTWEKVKNFSLDLITQPDSTLQNVVKDVAKDLKRFGKKVADDWNVVKDHVHKSFKKREKHEKKQQRKHHKAEKKQRREEKKHGQYKKWKAYGDDDDDDKGKRGKGKREKEEQYGQTKRRKHETDHYQKEDTAGQFSDFDPTTFFHDGFFEGNQREWRKYEKKIKSIHQRIGKLSEDILYSMDEDDIEDLYDDLDDLEDDVEDLEKPEQLKAWLTCQLRWWKSRYQRKKRDKDLIQGCSQLLQRWQLKVSCTAACHDKKKCKKGKKGKIVHNICKNLQQSQATRQFKKNFRDKTDYQDDSDDKYQQKMFTKALHDDPQVPAEKSCKDAPVPVPEDVEETDNHTMSDAEWLFRRAQFRDDTHADATWYVQRLDETPEQGAADPLFLLNQPAETPSTQDVGGSIPDGPEPTWLFSRGLDLEYRMHKTDWVFERADERDYERNKPWYMERAEGRQLYTGRD